MADGGTGESIGNMLRAENIVAPTVNPAPTWSDKAPSNGGPRVTSTQALWKARADATRKASAALTDSASSVAKVLRGNYFGTGCAEGEDLYDRLKIAISSSGWQAILNNQIEQLSKLSADCEAAGEAIAEVDSSVAQAVIPK